MGLGFVIDVTRSLDRALQGRLPTGVDRVILEYVQHFMRSAQALVRLGGRWVVLNPRDSATLFGAMLAPDRFFRLQVRWLVGRAYLLNWRRPVTSTVLLNLGHSGLQEPSYARRINANGWRALYFLHDLIPITHPEYCRSGEAGSHHQRLKTMLTTAGGIVVNSAATADELSAYARDKRLPLPPCQVAWLAPGRLCAPLRPRPLPVPYFVMLGTIEPRKNHLLLLQVWRALVERHGAAAPRLVIVGQRGWECEQVLDLLERCESLRGVVLEQPRCPDQELSTWLAHAQALLFPSFAEGYGMPLVEALSVGLPVLASDLPAFREVAGDIPEYLDPLDGPGWAAAIMDYAQPDSARRLAQCDRMNGWEAPTWEAHFEQVDVLVERCFTATHA